MRPLLALVAAGLTTAAAVLVLRPPPLVAPQTSAAFLDRMDTDDSGSVSAAEYARVSDGLVEFAVLDSDGSGALELWEVEQLLLRISPDTPQPTLLPRVR